MRIHERDSSSFGGTGRSRIESFRRNHTVGQTVRGRVLKWQDSRLVWISIDGQPLLSELRTSAVPGSILLFKILALKPHIHLQALPGQESNLPQTLSGVMDFTAARRHFESLFTPHAPGLNRAPFINRPLLMTKILSNDIGLMQAHAAVQDCVDAVNSLPNSHVLRYSPLSLPVAREQASFLNTTRSTPAFYELIVEFTLPEVGGCQLVCMHKAGHTGYRLKMRDITHLKALRHVLERSTSLAADAEFLGVEIQKGPPGGMLSQLLSQ